MRRTIVVKEDLHADSEGVVRDNSPESVNNREVI
jgi:hypothetical protein